MQTQRKESRTQIKNQSTKTKRQQILQVNSLHLPIIASGMGASVIGGGRERSGCKGLYLGGATKQGRAKRMAGGAVMEELCARDRVMVEANDYGAKSCGILIDGA
jgi:hypothetical protein